MKFTLRYKAWFGICPVYVSDLDDPAPLVLERHWLLVPLYMLTEAIYDAMFAIMGMMGNEPEGWPLRITGELAEPFDFEVPDEE